MGVPDELEKLERLHQSGALSNEEFAKAKADLLNRGSGIPLFSSGDTIQQTRQWGLLLHLSQFAGYVIPLGGFLAPILIWQIKKSELPAIDEQGKIVANWILSYIIYVFVAALSIIVIIGIVLLPIVLVLGVVFPIVGAIKASNGEVWPYPLSIKFFK
jgi:uncharacterized protein